MSGGVLEHVADLSEDMARHILGQCASSEQNDAAFSAAAATVLDEHPLVDALDPVALLDALPADLDAGRLAPYQSPSKFSDCQLLLYADAQINIQLLVWLTGTTTVHDHNFCGAFRMIRGQSLHCTYDFHKARRDMTCGVLPGVLELRKSELIKPGDIRRIAAGRGFVHSSFHLDAPSVTLLVARSGSGNDDAQYDYRGGALAVDESGLPIIVVRQIQALKILHRLEPGKFLRRLTSCLSVADFGRKYWILRALDRAITGLTDKERQSLHDYVLGLEDGALLLDALFREKLIYSIVSLREKYSDQATRFVLALFANVKDPAHWPSLLDRYSRLSGPGSSDYAAALDAVFAESFWGRLFPSSRIKHIHDYLRGLVEQGTGDGRYRPCDIPEHIRENTVFQNLFPAACRPDHPVAENVA